MPPLAKRRTSRRRIRDRADGGSALTVDGAVEDAMARPAAP
jgi:hypothetical protein